MDGASELHEPSFDRILRIPHILDGICLQYLPFWSHDGSIEEADQDQKIKLHRQILAKMARVCKAFAPPALDVLWTNLDNFECLLQLFPSYQDHWNERMISGITPPQWQRFQTYARRVRGLRWTLFSSLAVTHRTVWTLLEYQSGGQPLLPRLHTLAVLNLDHNFVQPLMLLLTPSLRTLSLSFGFSESTGLKEVVLGETPSSRRVSAIADILLRQITSAPQLSLLSSLCIGDDGLPRDFPSSYFTSLSQLNGLKTLDLLYSGAVIDTATLQLVSNIPSLRSLSLEISLNGIDFRSTLKPGGGELEELHLSGSIGDLRRAFDAATLPNVVSFALTVTSVPNVDALKDALDLICSKVSRAVYEVTLFIKPRIASHAVSLADILRPCFSFRNMSAMSIEFDEYIPRMDDQDALAFATAWPSITHFSYSWYTMPEDRPDNPPAQPTVAGLLAFAQRCPELYILTLPALDVRDLPSPLSIPAAGQKALRHLQIPEYLGGDTANLLNLAIILDRLFPLYAGTRSITMQGRVVPFIFDGVERYRSQKITGLLVEAIQAQRRMLEDDASHAAEVISE